MRSIGGHFTNSRFKAFSCFLTSKNVFSNPNLLKVSQKMIKSLINWFRNNLNRNREKYFFSYDLTLWFHNFNSNFDPENLRIEESCNWLFCSPLSVDSENEIKNPFFGLAQLDGDTLKRFLNSLINAWQDKKRTTFSLNHLNLENRYVEECNYSRVVIFMNTKICRDFSQASAAYTRE